MAQTWVIIRKTLLAESRQKKKKSTSSVGRKASIVPVKDFFSALSKTLSLGSFRPCQPSLSQILLSGAGLYVIGARDGPNSEDWTIKIYLPTTPDIIIIQLPLISAWYNFGENKDLRAHLSVMYLLLKYFL